jgi:hypothetical protein
VQEVTSVLDEHITFHLQDRGNTFPSETLVTIYNTTWFHIPDYNPLFTTVKISNIT